MINRETAPEETRPESVSQLIADVQNAVGLLEEYLKTGKWTGRDSKIEGSEGSTSEELVTLMGRAADKINELEEVIKLKREKNVDDPEIEKVFEDYNMRLGVATEKANAMMNKNY
jgi:hypothetical protein